MRGKIRRALVVTTLLVFATGAVSAPAAAEQGPVAHFVVLGVEGKPLDRVVAAVVAAGGRVSRSWPQIGVVVATSPDAAFAAAVRGRPGVVAAGNTRNLAELDEGATTARRAESTPVAHVGEEPLDQYQWALRQIGGDRAHEITDGNRDVLVGVLDSRIHADNPDLAPNIDETASVSCAGGVPNTSRAAWTAPPDATFAHATAVAGVIAAARNGVGIAGVAPNVRIAAVALSDNGYVFPEEMICGYVWAAEHGVDVTNASFSVDPWVRWCDDDPDQAAAAAAMMRAIDYAADHDVVNVAASGNANWDLSHPVLDTYSPVNGEPVERLTGHGCRQLPTEAPDVLIVSGVGADKLKAQYSNYGIRDVDLTAPSGDGNQIPDVPGGNPGVITPVNLGEWGFFGGTSAAAPHAVGVVALLRGTHPDWSAQRVIAAVQRDADRLPCPPGGVFDPDGTGEWLAHCEGGRSGKGFYGSGLVDALAAVATGDPGRDGTG
ncbi:S8 family peptidase [Actinophytocola sp. NPDC049390]|uniref:S8 family peptidase n=1 Tax=Actinophytocola sp. NPDC049390 TaxID=3363894 RepID=UPI0037A3BE2B